MAGILVGWFLGRLPFAFSSWMLKLSLQRASVVDLRLRLESQYFISHLIIAELVKRGELVESFRSVVEQQLASQSSDVQRFGRANARSWFPDLVSSQGVEEN